MCAQEVIRAHQHHRANECVWRIGIFCLHIPSPGTYITSEMLEVPAFSFSLFLPQPSGPVPLPFCFSFLKRSFLTHSIQLVALLYSRQFRRPIIEDVFFLIR